jgi:hypothetical protein
MWHSAKRWLYLIHRWIGVATCLLFAMWFASGLVMLHVPFPELGENERLDGLAPIAWNAVEHVPATDAGLREAVLEMRGQRPLWRLYPWEAEPRSVWADTGQPAGPAGEAEARAIAAAFAGRPVAAMHRIRSDQWTVAGSYDAHRPLWRADLDGPGGRVLYLSSATGEVVLDTDRRERMWNWLGSVPHWLYPRALREDQPLWRQVVMWASGPCILVALTGTWIGLMRLRAGRRRFKGGRMTPYRGWMKWHHVSGLVGAVFLILWIFSGWLSVDPFRLFASEGPGLAEQRAYAGSAPLPLAAVTGLAGTDARRVVVQAAAGVPFLTVQRANGPPLLRDAGLRPLLGDRARLEQAARQLIPGANLSGVELLTRPDAYWYAVRGDLPLPVLRLRFDDSGQTWLHLDSRSGELLGGGDAKRRTYRWLFDLFHRWDLNLLLETRPTREVLIWLMSLFGLASSLSGVVVGWRRLRRKAATSANGRLLTPASAGNT